MLISWLLLAHLIVISLPTDLIWYANSVRSLISLKRLLHPLFIRKYISWFSRVQSIKKSPPFEVASLLAFLSIISKNALKHLINSTSDSNWRNFDSAINWSIWHSRMHRLATLMISCSSYVGCRWPTNWDTNTSCWIGPRRSWASVSPGSTWLYRSVHKSPPLRSNSSTTIGVWTVERSHRDNFFSFLAHNRRDRESIQKLFSWPIALSHSIRIRRWQLFHAHRATHSTKWWICTVSIPAHRNPRTNWNATKSLHPSIVLGELFDMWHPLICQTWNSMSKVSVPSTIWTAHDRIWLRTHGWRCRLLLINKSNLSLK